VAGAQLLGKKGLAESDLRQSGHVIERQAQHLTQIVDDLLDVSRATRGKVTLRKAEVRVADFIASAIESTREFFDSKRHTLRVSGTGERIWVDGDEVRLTQIVTNLLNNAAKFTPEGGHVDLDVTAGDATVMIVVTDSGIGIAPEVLPHVFEPFTQADSAAGRATSGLGIGLHLVRTLTALHGGSVDVQSEGLGRGSRFTARLPRLLQEVEVARAAPPPRAPAPAPRVRILLVDDNEDASLTLAMLLRMEGHDVTVARDGPEALQIARAFRPDAVLLDIGMPGMDGYEVGRRLRADPTTADVVMIAVTGYGHTDARTRSKAAGFDQHIVKPVDPAALIQSLSKLGTRIH
jgi:CheY-like chemotaxis protein/two-component sensor histidine kinase